MKIRWYCVQLMWIFVSLIFRCPQRNFVESFEFAATSAKFWISNVQKFAKFLKNFDEYKAQIASKFAFITFAQYCTFSGWLQHANKSSSIEKNCTTAGVIDGLDVRFSRHVNMSDFIPSYRLPNFKRMGNMLGFCEQRTHQHPLDILGKRCTTVETSYISV